MRPLGAALSEASTETHALLLSEEALVACRREIVSMGFGEKIGLNGWHPPCVNLLSAFGCGGRSNIFSATGH